MVINFELWDDKKLFDEMFRATGKSTKLVDELIQEFFEKPMGTRILVCDHYPERQADEYLLDRFMKRLESEHPSATCKIHRGEHITIERTSPTYHEMVKEEYERRQQEKNKKNENLL
jgi:adenylate kinase family enzyme